MTASADMEKDNSLTAPSFLSFSFVTDRPDLIGRPTSIWRMWGGDTHCEGSGCFGLDPGGGLVWPVTVHALQVDSGSLQCVGVPQKAWPDAAH